MKTLNTRQAAVYLGKSVSWMTKARMRGDGPVYLKLGGNVRYLPADPDAWMTSQRRTAIHDFVNRMPM